MGSQRCQLMRKLPLGHRAGPQRTTLWLDLLVALASVQSLIFFLLVQILIQGCILRKRRLYLAIYFRSISHACLSSHYIIDVRARTRVPRFAPKSLPSRAIACRASVLGETCIHRRHLTQ